jgi:hypothetical protein
MSPISACHQSSDEIGDTKKACENNGVTNATRVTIVVEIYTRKGRSPAVMYLPYKYVEGDW